LLPKLCLAKFLYSKNLFLWIKCLRISFPCCLITTRPFSSRPEAPLRQGPILSLAKILSGFEITNLGARTRISSAITLLSGRPVPALVRSTPSHLRHSQRHAAGEPGYSQQLAVLKRQHPKPKLGLLDKLFGVATRRLGSDWKTWYRLVVPESVDHPLQSAKTSW